ncbi:uncharacterized protein K489DRAFT_134603 [Dissoconium aciculare CBS 342.82]|uniref:Secreted protein n=1 Tax=Dissoconium aciculare CBS 342.82 TaxID=1314786 RepID=A0A6J3LQX3_9PEZI|nr:uncharacterized protein K489DRAFT_134603 [Dissoconium aciculare CBS 342.82]KAF1818023.1 hypothetical protein K489DRAFT_134603 [Dissoconium aciculare CBS 342.82]
MDHQRRGKSVVLFSLFFFFLLPGYMTATRFPSPSYSWPYLRAFHPLSLLLIQRASYTNFSVLMLHLPSSPKTDVTLLLTWREREERKGGEERRRDRRGEMCA